MLSNNDKIRIIPIILCCLLQDGALLDDSELDQLSLIDAVLPGVVSSRHSLISNKIIKPEIPAVNDLLHASSDGYMNSVPQDDCDAVMFDNGSQKALVLKGHGSEVCLTYI